MVTKNDPLQGLVAKDVGSIDRTRVANFLHSFVVIDGSTKEISFLSEFQKINSNPEKMEIILLAAKARSLLFEVSDGLSPVDIIALDIMPVGSVKSSLKILFDSRKIKKDKDGRYFLPGYRINEIINKYNNKD